MKKNQKSKILKYLNIINKIEKVRSKNNVNWMDVLRVALKHAPEETIKLMKEINRKDRKISNLFNSIK
ncbi:hypothetical protein OAJ20_04360 [Candidatus Pelagibacter sp.]|nr:hypothetical protein [Candidatus Pelagibacter sp.]|tara:strand:+ start:244 stop:447 length:204 start_codon:yes stop_codon:yes gene_type:complete